MPSVAYLFVQNNIIAQWFSNGQAPVVQTLDSAIHWINHYPLDNSIGFASVYPLDSDLSGGQRYPSFEQLGPGGWFGEFLFTMEELKYTFRNLYLW